MLTRLLPILFLATFSYADEAADGEQAARRAIAAKKALVAKIKAEIERHRIDPERFPLKDSLKAYLGKSEPPEEFKDAVTTKHWREFSAETVVLARFGKTVWTEDETLEADIYVDHRGDYRIEEATVYWNISDSDESIVGHRAVSIKPIEPKSRGKVCTLSLELPKADYLEAPTRLDIEIMLRFPGYRNPECPNSNRYSVDVVEKQDIPGAGQAVAFGSNDRLALHGFPCSASGISKRLPYINNKR